jgi:hypothetical protein
LEDVEDASVINPATIRGSRVERSRFTPIMSDELQESMEIAVRSIEALPDTAR